ncbi:MAG: M81 family metallopeptidase [Neisseriaceae bacterium]|nr:M81 family metallopeptidase [Neisseriaceae bacterium]MBP6862577.1 M81 family metallopeptidase [Neisseriaceae bacterium]
MRIIIAGFQHETNTFAPTQATYDKFEHGGGYPPMCHGNALFDLKDMNIPVAGFINQAQQQGHELIPVLWTAAAPSAHVTEDAFERICAEITAAVAEHQPDGVYLDLHGAMVCVHVDDGEGELLARLRALLGPNKPLVASLDLHANVTELMLTSADRLVAYRTYPHVDMAETGARAAVQMHACLNGESAVLVSRRLPFLTPINAQCTFVEPARSVYAAVAELEQNDMTSMSFATGFPAADFPECGGVVWGYAPTKAIAQASVDLIYQQIVGNEAAWDISFLSPEAAVAEAMALAANADKPVVIADTQDNPGAGGDANTMGVLKALVAAKAQKAAIGLIVDPAAVAAAYAAGEGAHIDIALAGTSGIEGDSPLQATFTVKSLSDGRCQYGGPMMHGVLVDVGRSACLMIDDIAVVVSTDKAQMLDRNLFRMAGVHPEEMAIVVVKSSVHFRADFEPIAAAVLIAKAPGPLLADPVDLPWQNLRPGIRLKPLGPVFQP